MVLTRRCDREEKEGGRFPGGEEGKGAWTTDGHSLANQRRVGRDLTRDRDPDAGEELLRGKGVYECDRRWMMRGGKGRDGSE